VTGDPSGDGYTADTDRLARHATALDDVADAVALAADAVRTVTLDSTAYGVFCQALPAMLRPLQDRIGSAVTARAEQVADVAAGVRATAATYDEAEDTNAAMFDGLAGPGGNG
jgi:hypothetical protein